jgi:hypothetical protein
MNDYGMNGLLAVHVPIDGLEAPRTEMNIAGQGLDRQIVGDTVTYSYHLKEYQDKNVSFSEEKVLHSSSRCLGRAVVEDEIYERGEKIARPAGKFKPILWIPENSRSRQSWEVRR